MPSARKTGRRKPAAINAPLAGLRVIDASRVLAGPYLAMLLGDLGADVIKLERPGDGDPTRAWGPPFVGNGEVRTSAYFVSANRNKRSLALDLKHPAGQNVWTRLLEGADIVVENFLPRDWKSLHLGSSRLTRRYPRLIQCTITGYGASGPDADRPAYDLALQAESGLMAITGFPTGEPVRVGIAIVDFLAALYGLNGLLAALYSRERTGRGRRVEVTMAASASAFLSYAAQSWLTDGSEAPRLGSAHPNLVPYRAFTASDDWFAVAVGSEAQWRRFCISIGDPELATQPQFRDNAARVRHRVALERRLARQFKTLPRAEWLARMHANRVPAAAVATLGDALREAVERGTVRALPAGVYGVLQSIAPPFLFDGRRPRLERSAPGLGEHSDAILGESGFSRREIAALRSAAAIA